ncbi:MAG: CopD family protein [Maribacter sp.]|nr:CopD family protein [Maribacter sp.]
MLSRQLKLMTKRLWNSITWPSAILCSVFGLWLLLIQPIWLQEPWMHVKLGFVVLLILYHLKCHKMYKQLQGDVIKYTSRFMRIWNEGATLILFAVVFLVILKSAFSWIFGLLGIFVLGILLMLGIRLYKRIQDKNPNA